MSGIQEQMGKHSVALVALLVAVLTLGYTAWRQEVSERQRTVRTAGFELLRELGALQMVMDQAHFAGDAERGDPIKGWSHVLLAEDFAMFMDPEVQAAVKALHQRWEEEWPKLGEDEDAATRLTATIEVTRLAVRAELSRLD